MKVLLTSFLFLFSLVTLAGVNGNAVTQVENKKVCMVTDTYFGKDQIPVSVGSKTYYGCCAGCKKTLTEKENARYGVDQITLKRVDKATAVIGAKADGKVFYFENLANLRAFNKR